MASTLKGPVVVTGGTGFMGYHLVCALLRELPGHSIISVNRNPTGNLCDEVDYRAGSVTDTAFIETLIAEVKPEIIFHVASPQAMNTGIKASTYQDTNVEGTRALLDCATKSPHVRAFVYTSTVNVQAGDSHCNVDESGPLWSQDSNCLPYWRSKAEAERLVLQANSKDLSTVALRLPLIIGERDYIVVPGYLDALDKKQTRMQLGNGKNKIDTVSAENAAEAHLIAAKALLNPSLAAGKVDGEAFHITDGNPTLFWDICRTIWNEAGDTTQLKDVTVVPGWAAMAMASAAEWSYAIFTFWTKTPELTTHVVGFCINEYTYNIDKARRVLKFNPTANTEQVLREATRWELEKRRSAGNKISP